MIPTDSSRRSSRSPKPDPQAWIPNALCSRSNQAPPMPRIARPSLMWSTVVASFAVSPGSRNVFAPTISPTLIRFVTAAVAAIVVQPSKIGCSHGPKIASRWSHVQTESQPTSSARTRRVAERWPRRLLAPQLGPEPHRSVLVEVVVDRDRA